VFILKRYFTSYSFAAVHEAFSSVYPNKEDLKLNVEQTVANTDPETLNRVA
jgi:hypothetical protein